MIARFTSLTLALCALPLSALAVQVQVTVTNLAPANGTFLTPVWVGFHDGTFDTYDVGAPVSAAVERLAEDGTTDPIIANFAAAGFDQQAALTSTPVFAPGASATMTFDLDAMNADHRYFSFLTMIIPSNDAFIGNGDPLQFEIFDAAGNFIGLDRVVSGAMVLDAGSEVNDEVHDNTAFFGQAAPDTGVAENGVVHSHPGFIPGGLILSDPMFANADFLAPGYNVARVTVALAPVPEPETWAMLAAGLALVGVAARRRRR